MSSGSGCLPPRFRNGRSKKRALVDPHCDATTGAESPYAETRSQPTLMSSASTVCDRLCWEGVIRRGRPERSLGRQRSRGLGRFRQMNAIARSGLRGEPRLLPKPRRADSAQSRDGAHASSGGIRDVSWLKPLDQSHTAPRVLLTPGARAPPRQQRCSLLIVACEDLPGDPWGPATGDVSPRAGVGSRSGHDLLTMACRSQRLGIDPPVAPSSAACCAWRAWCVASVVGRAAGWRRRERCARRLPGICLAQGSERGAHLLGEDLGLLPGGEVPAVVGLVEVGEIGVGLLDPAARSCVDLVGERGEADR
jgi:hypothetical protein